MRAHVCVPFSLLATLGSKPSWDEGKKLLSSMNFMERLRDYDKENIPKKVIQNLQKYMANPKFVPEEVKKVRGGEEMEPHYGALSHPLVLIHPPAHTHGTLSSSQGLALMYQGLASRT